MKRDVGVTANFRRVIFGSYQSCDSGRWYISYRGKFSAVGGNTDDEIVKDTEVKQ